MAICDDLIVVVTPNRVKCFAFSCDSDGQPLAYLLKQITLSYSVGFADAKFIDSVAPGRSVEDLRVCVSGADGLYLLSFSSDELQSADSNPAASCIFSQPRPPGIGLSSASDVTVAFCPVIDAHGTISWYEGINNCEERPLSFCTISHSAANGMPRTPLKFSHQELPALYGMGVRDYNPGLGLAVFGNYYGELVLFNLGCAKISKISAIVEKGIRGAAPQNIVLPVSYGANHPTLHSFPDTLVAHSPGFLWPAIPILRPFGAASAHP